MTSGKLILIGTDSVLTVGLRAVLSHDGFDIRHAPDSGARVAVVGPRRMQDATWAELGRAGVPLGRTLALCPPASPAGLRAAARGVGACLSAAAPTPHVLSAVRALATGSTRTALAPPWWAGLTRRQAEILALTAQARSTAETAAELAVSERTVRNTLSALYRVLGVRDRSEAVAWAWATGWLAECAGPPPVTFVPTKRDRYH